MDQSNYSVVFEDYTKNHYVKAFRKKYSAAAWGITEDAIRSMCEHIDNLRFTSKLDKIMAKENFSICKLDFAVAGTKESAKTSGNRCIILIDETKRLVRILLVYSKNDVLGKNETMWWKEEIFKTYQDIVAIFRGNK